MRTLIAASFFVLLAGCAASVRTSGDAEPLAIPLESRSTVAVQFSGSGKVLANPQWGRLTASWRGALQREASNVGYRLSAPRGDYSSPAPATLLRIEVSNFRYLTSDMRFSFGVMTGNAWVDAKVEYIDAETGALYGSRTYNTSSSAWEGVLSAMTDEQLAALSREIISEIARARHADRPQQTLVPHSPVGLSQEQRIQQLLQQNLPYDEYQKRYREIMNE